MITDIYLMILRFKLRLVRNDIFKSDEELQQAVYESDYDVETALVAHLRQLRLERTRLNSRIQAITLTTAGS